MSRRLLSGFLKCDQVKDAKDCSNPFAEKTAKKRRGRETRRILQIHRHVQSLWSMFLRANGPRLRSRNSHFLCIRTASHKAFSETLNLPKTSFAVRPNHAENREKYLQACTDDLYAWQSSARPDRPLFVLHDGPPYANGDLHIGHALNKILKDIILRYQVLQGNRVSFVPGWDCHGLPIELKALQDCDLKIKSSALQIREKARQLAEDTIINQESSFRQFAVMADWKNAYRTMGLAPKWYEPAKICL